MDELNEEKIDGTTTQEGTFLDTEIGNNPDKDASDAPADDTLASDAPTGDILAPDASADSSLVQVNPVLGKDDAMTSMVLGITSVVLWFSGYGAAISIITGIVGLVLSKRARKNGYLGGTRTAGFVLNTVGIAGGAVTTVAFIFFLVWASGFVGLLV